MYKVLVEKMKRNKKWMLIIACFSILILVSIRYLTPNRFNQELGPPSTEIWGVSQQKFNITLIQINENPEKATFQYQDEIFLLESQTGKKLTQVEKDRVFDDMMKDKVTVPYDFSLFISPKKYFMDTEEVSIYTASPDQLKRATINIDGESVKIASIPASFRASIEQEFAKRGRLATESQIAKAWIKAGRPQ